jgi:hypothetical protein
VASFWSNSSLRQSSAMGRKSCQADGKELAGATGLEPATSGVTGRHSNQLSYAPAGDRERLRRGDGELSEAARLVKELGDLSTG